MIFKKLFSLDKKLCVLALSSNVNDPAAEIIESIYDEAIDWFRHLGVEPEYFSSLDVSGFTEAKKYDFIYADRKLRRRGFNNIKGVYISSERESVEFGFTINSSSCSAIKLIWMWPEKISDFDLNSINDLIESAHNFIDVYYAAAFKVKKNEKIKANFCLSPFENIKIRKGIVSVTANNKCLNDIASSGYYENSFLKDVYDIQLLSKDHMSYIIDSISLRDWINSSESNGYLIELCDEKWIWVVDDNLVEGVRNKLIGSNLLTSYLVDNDDFLKKYGKPN